MARRQAFKGRRLVRAELVDIGTGYFSTRANTKSMKTSKGSLLLTGMQCQTLIELDAFVLALDAHAGKVLQPVRGNKWVA